MTHKVSSKVAFAAVIACICAACLSLPAVALYYVHDDVQAEAASTGAVEICCTVDETAVGGGVSTSLIFVPTDSTAEACLTEFIFSQNAHNNPTNIHDHAYSTLGDYLKDKKYSVTVYDAASQKPGTQTTYDTKGTEGISTKLNRFDNVVFKVQ